MDKKSLILSIGTILFTFSFSFIFGCSKSEGNTNIPNPRKNEKSEEVEVKTKNSTKAQVSNLNETKEEDPSEEKPDLAGMPKKFLEALERAKKAKKPLLVEIFDTECNFCQDMEKVLAEDEVQEVLKSFVYIKLGKEATKIIEDNALTMTPTFLCYKPNGVQLDDILEGFWSKKTIIAQFKNFLLAAEGKETFDLPEDNHPNAGKG